MRWQLGLLLCWVSGAHALTLGEAIELAQQNDPTYLSAQASLSISQARAHQAFASRLPQLTASANTNDNRRDYGVLNRNTNTAEHYNSHTLQINLTQPVWHPEKQAAEAQADLLVGQSDYQLAAAQQDLLLRLAQAWLDIQQARDAVVAGDSQVLATESQWIQAQRSAQLGVLATPEREAARAKYDLALAEQAQAKMEVELKFVALERVTGVLSDPNGTDLSYNYMN